LIKLREISPDQAFSMIDKELATIEEEINNGYKIEDDQDAYLQDLLGMNNEFNPKFLKKYLNGFQLIQSTLNEFNKDVKLKIYPSDKESF